MRCVLTQLGDTGVEGVERLLASVEHCLGYSFGRPDLLLQALTHSSFSNEYAAKNPSKPALPDNERLEYLGDAVIGLVIAQALMEAFPLAAEGKLSRWRSNLVSRRVLSELALENRIGQYLLLGCGERRSGGESKNSILAALFEALIGALYLDGGIEAARDVLGRVYASRFRSLVEDNSGVERWIDKKTFLQEKTQGRFGSVPSYRVVDTWGLEHEKNFRVEIMLDGQVVAEGDGLSKKEAEQTAAGRALEILGF